MKILGKIGRPTSTATATQDRTFMRKHPLGRSNSLNEDGKLTNQAISVIFKATPSKCQRDIALVSTARTLDVTRWEEPAPTSTTAPNATSATHSICADRDNMPADSTKVWGTSTCKTDTPTDKISENLRSISNKVESKLVDKGLITPIKASNLEEMLISYEGREYLVEGFKRGFKIGYQGDHSSVRGKNSKSILLNLEKAEEKIDKEVNLGRIKGPFVTPP